MNIFPAGAARDTNIPSMPLVSCTASVPMQWYIHLCFASSTPPFKFQVGKRRRNGLKASLGSPKTQDCFTMTCRLRGEASDTVTNSTSCSSPVVLTQQHWAVCVQVRSRELVSGAKPQLGIKVSPLGSLNTLCYAFTPNSRGTLVLHFLCSSYKIS